MSDINELAALLAVAWVGFGLIMLFAPNRSYDLSEEWTSNGRRRVYMERAMVVWKYIGVVLFWPFLI